MPEDKLLDRVRQLLAKAESTDSPEEAEALTAKAAEMMAKYGIEQAVLDASKPKADNKPGSRKIIPPDPYADAKAHFLAGLAQAMRCQAVLLSGTDKPTMHLFGFESDLDLLEMLFTSLLVQQQRAMTSAERSLTYFDRQHMRAWRRSFLLGFATGAVRKVKDANRVAEAEKTSTPGTDLVLADRSLQVKAAVSQEYPLLRRTKMTYSGGGYGHGYKAGQRADIGGSRVGAGSRRALS